MSQKIGLPKKIVSCATITWIPSDRLERSKRFMLPLLQGLYRRIRKPLE